MSQRRAGGPRRGAVLFDLFGTLVDVDAARLPAVELDGERRPSTYPRWAGLLEGYVGGRSLVEVLEAFRAVAIRGEDTAERPSRLRFRALLDHLGCEGGVLEEAAVVLSRAHMAAIVEATVVSPVQRAVLDAARSVAAVAVVSNFDDTGSAYAILARHGLLDRIDAIAVSEAIGRRKPHPLPVVAALTSLDVAPADAVFVGDGAAVDVGAARAAGVRVVLIAPNGTSLAPAPDLVVVARLGDVPRALGW
jgi:FMN phosphatase YigB (HAD superfamily)